MLGSQARRWQCWWQWEALCYNDSCVPFCSLQPTPQQSAHSKPKRISMDRTRFDLPPLYLRLVAPAGLRSCSGSSGVLGRVGLHIKDKRWLVAAAPGLSEHLLASGRLRVLVMLSSALCIADKRVLRKSRCSHYQSSRCKMARNCVSNGHCLPVTARCLPANPVHQQHVPLVLAGRASPRSLARMAAHRAYSPLRLSGCGVQRGRASTQTRAFECRPPMCCPCQCWCTSCRWRSAQHRR